MIVLGHAAVAVVTATAASDRRIRPFWTCAFSFFVCHGFLDLLPHVEGGKNGDYLMLGSSEFFLAATDNVASLIGVYLLLRYLPWLATNAKQIWLVALFAWLPDLLQIFARWLQHDLWIARVFFEVHESTHFLREIIPYHTIVGTITTIATIGLCVLYLRREHLRKRQILDPETMALMAARYQKPELV